MTLGSSAKPNHRNRGWKPVFPRQVSNGLLDLRAIRQEEESLQLIEEQGATPAVRRQAKAARNAIEVYLDERIRLLQTEADSHEREIRGHESEMCRRYDLKDPSAAQLKALCGGQCEECRPTAA